MNYLVIPAYQPDQKLLKLVQKLREKCDFSIIVVDDGSSEECQAILKIRRASYRSSPRSEPW